jgi:alkylated DNA nucleotide flippase Atl1
MPKRPKLFTNGRQTPIDRNDRARVMFLARAARHRGAITRAAEDILAALLYVFANLRDGRCFPSYARLAEAAGCAERTVGRCLPDLEAAGFVSWCHRIRRAREYVAGLAGIGAVDWRVMRTSNAYDFPACAKRRPAIADTGHLSRGTENPDLSSSLKEPTPLDLALARLGAVVGARSFSGGSLT